MNNSMGIKSTVRAYIADNILMSGSADLGEDTSFLALSILDSTGIAELVAFLQEAFGIEILDEEIVPENLDSLNAIQAFVERKGAAR